MNALQPTLIPQPFIDGLQYSVNSDTAVGISAGQCTDSTGGFTMDSLSALVCDIGVNGANGLDTGAAGNSLCYALFLLNDKQNGQAPASLLSLSFSDPVLPAGYTCFRLIGYVFTDATADLIAGVASGNGATREFLYDAPVATAVTAGASATMAAVSLAASVPAIDDALVRLNLVFTPAAASNTLKITAGASATAAASAPIAAYGQVAAVPVNLDWFELAQLVSSVPSINYAVSAGAVAVNVRGFQYSL